MFLRSRWEFNVVSIETSHFFRASCFRIITEQVHNGIPVRNEINIGANPHGKNILCVISPAGRNVLQLRCSQFIHPDIVSLTSFVVFPGAEFAKHPVQGKVFPVRGERAETAFGGRDLVQFSSLGRNGKQVCPHARETVPAGTEHHFFPVRSPSHYNVVRTHAVAYVVSVQSGCICQPPGLTTGYGDGVYFRIAVVLSCKGNRFSVG